MLPLIAGLRLPGWPLHGQQGQIQLGAGRDGIGTHLCGERVGGVDDMGDVMRTQVIDQPCTPPKPPTRTGKAGVRRVWVAPA
jgi:hypothetical protein